MYLIISDGIQFWGNLYDHNRNMCIEVDYQLTITLQIKATNIYFITRTPMVEDLEVCNHASIIIP